MEDGRYTRPKLALALAEICAAVGLDSRDARLLRFVNNGVFLLEREQVIVRIVLAPSFSYRAVNVVEAARWLAEHDVPAVRLLPGIRQPVRVGGHLATLWRSVPDTGARPTGAHLGRLLRRVHSLPRPTTLPEWRPMEDVRRRLFDAEELDSDDRYFLEQRCDDVEQRLDALRFPLPRGVVHGDAHLGNLIVTPGGPVLCDLDSLCVGPPEWDLTPMAVGRLRLGHPPERYEELARAYGFDLLAWEGFQVLRDLRELKITVSVLPILRSNPGIRGELRRRLRTMRAGDVTAQWAPYN
ncbi:phosphotransferase enzyme family protein [Saccharopolyspora erythraea]|uniref:Aminoglycoside phosphotransferase n=2 Tax=Saccharopolyspora erythraea TaxID=1836 RepID=A4F5U9_SACEN|nr:aminoglycoside phosphotransferase family protein [Saccharopolyspora erythraea]EQD84204.1 aminoglycoside phosphotransferase [Saccharopolyspora erythraea D]QRK90078.1 aminoglycoside phosphotransferase family protein [Saccharopolyspora erythraea]CAL99423.1 aminoglycoside phosphotransferase [Saccharopolyspora erythraea NRRL 2338]